MRPSLQTPRRRQGEEAEQAWAMGGCVQDEGREGSEPKEDTGIGRKHAKGRRERH
jgi:hypothetical protein